MPVNKIKIVKNALLLYLRMGIMLIISLYTTRVVLRQLGSSDFGIYNVVGGVVTMLSFLNATLTHGVQRFYNYYIGKKDDISVNKVLWASLVIMSVLGVLIILLGETLGLWFLNSRMNIPLERISAANWVLHLSLLSTLFSLFTVPFSAIVISHEDFNIYAFISIGSAICNLVCAFVLQTAGGDKLVLYSILMSTINAVLLLVYISVCKNKYKSVRIQYHKDRALFSAILSFSGWNILGTTSNVVTTSGINIILNIFFGTIINAARGIAVQISTKVDEFINNIQQAMNPQIVQLYAKGDYETVQALVFDNFKWNFAMYWIVALPLLFELEYVLFLWLGDIPEYTATFTFIIIIRSFLKCFERPINSLNFAIGKMKNINIFASVTALITILLIIMLFKLGFPAFWAFIVDLLFVASGTLYYMLQAQKNELFSIQAFLKSVLLPILVVVLFSTTGTFALRLINLSGFGSLVYTVFVTLVLSSILILYILFTKDNRAKVFGFVRGLLGI